MRGRPVGIEHIWHLKVAGAAIADEAIRQRYLEAIALVIRRVALAEEGRGELTEAAGELQWDESAAGVDDLSIADPLASCRRDPSS